MSVSWHVRTPSHYRTPLAHFLSQTVVTLNRYSAHSSPFSPADHGGSRSAPQPPVICFLFVRFLSLLNLLKWANLISRWPLLFLLTDPRQQSFRCFPFAKHPSLIGPQPSLHNPVPFHPCQGITMSWLSKHSFLEPCQPHHFSEGEFPHIPLTHTRLSDSTPESTQTSLHLKHLDLRNIL